MIGRLLPFEAFWDPGSGMFRNDYDLKFIVLFIFHVSPCKETVNCTCNQA